MFMLDPTSTAARRLCAAGLALVTMLTLAGCAARTRERPAPVDPPASNPPPGQFEYPAGPMPAPIIESPPTAPEPAGWNWVPGHWAERGGGWAWVEGHWAP